MLCTAESNPGQQPGKPTCCGWEGVGAVAAAKSAENADAMGRVPPTLKFADSGAGRKSDRRKSLLAGAGCGGTGRAGADAGAPTDGMGS